MTLISISISQFLACPPILARVYFTFVNLPVTKSASIAGVTTTCEVIDTVHADSIEAVVAGTVIVVSLTPAAREATWAVTGEGVERVMTDSTIVAGIGGTVVNVDLTVGATKPIDTSAVVGIDAVSTDPIVSARVGCTLVNIILAVLPSISWHADAGKLSSSINAGSLIQTRVAVTLIDIDLTPRPSVPLRTSTLVRPRSVDTLTIMFTWSGYTSTLIYILLTSSA